MTRTIILLVWNPWRPIIDRLIVNSDGYLQRHCHWIALVSLAAFADLLSTIHFMHHYGVEYEVHPAIRVTSMILGPMIGPTLGKLAQLAAIGLVTLYCRRLAPYFFFAATMMYAWAAWYNVWGRFIYTPLLLRLMPPHW